MLITHIKFGKLLMLEYKIYSILTITYHDMIIIYLFYSHIKPIFSIIYIPTYIHTHLMEIYRMSILIYLHKI